MSCSFKPVFMTWKFNISETLLCILKSYITFTLTLFWTSQIYAIINFHWTLLCEMLFSILNKLGGKIIVIHKHKSNVISRGLVHPYFPSTQETEWWGGMILWAQSLPSSWKHSENPITGKKKKRSNNNFYVQMIKHTCDRRSIDPYVLKVGIKSGI